MTPLTIKMAAGAAMVEVCFFYLLFHTIDKNGAILNR